MEFKELKYEQDYFEKEEKIFNRNLKHTINKYNTTLD